MGSLLDKFEEHEGPVRGIAFHNTQPLFVSGGDDYKIKVWNWKQRRCNFTLNGHLDYVRTVFFHHESPWIISASDDQTIRIWNWQNRNCISILTGHNHYVMCAMFHPKDDLIVSASLDQSVRVWDISGLRKKHSSAPQQPTFDDIQRVAAAAASSGQQPDLFGSTDAIVKYVLEGHDRGVNWAAFHPTLPLIVSGADDRQVKLWRMNDTKAWEVDTCRGHYNNVSCVLFHPRAEIIISDSEDRTIRLWDMTKRTALHTFRREHDRFWIMGAHPELNLFAAGHDSGLIVFKLERERPPMTVYQNQLYYLRDKVIRVYDFASGNDVGLVSIKKATGIAAGSTYRGLSYNPAENSVIVTIQGETGAYEMYQLPRDHPSEPREASDVKKGTGSASVFVARNRFAVLDKSASQILIKDLKNETTKTVKIPTGVTDMFYAGTKNILLTTATSVILFDTEVRQSVAEITVSGIRQVVWSPDGNMVALLSKHIIIIANKQLEQLSMTHETMKIKGGAWDEIGIFVYSTLNHIKYVLPSGDNGIIKTLEQPVYLTKVKGKNVFALNRDAKLRVIAIDPTEYRFKLALNNKNYDEVLQIIRTSNLVGQSIIAYLQKKGYPEVALHFVKDPKTRFELALECGNIDVAVETARAMDNPDCWNKLAAEALKKGNHQVVEGAYQRTQNFDRLSLLYLITGNVDKLKKMLKIAESRKSAGVMSRFHNALYLGDVEDQIRMLREVGQNQLAYLTAKTHGLEEEAAAILEASGVETPPELPQVKNPELLKPPAPILRQSDSNWPLLTVSRGFFEGGFVPAGVQSASTKPLATATALAVDDLAQEAVGDWGGDDDELDLDDDFSVKPKAVKPVSATASTPAEDELEGEGWEDDLDLGIDDLPPDAPVSGAATSVVKLPTAGPAQRDAYLRSPLAVYHISAGSFETAMQLLNRQVGAVNFAPMKSLFMQVYMTGKTWLTATADTPAITFEVNTGEEKRIPVPAVTVSSAIATLQNAYGAVKNGGFSSAITLFRQILREILLVVVDKRAEVDEVKQLINVCREYIIGSRLGLLALETKESDPKRSLEVAAYFTHCQLQPPHLQRSLHSAMVKAVKIKNMATALSLARRLLEMGPPAEMGQQAKRVQQAAERNATDAIELNYDQYNPFQLCGISLTPIYAGSPCSKCVYCGTSYKMEYVGKLCATCEISAVGAEGTGLKLM
ncbi:hypothetical protein HK098_002828, partial [Nowakowskiella sp. JEL0407]